MFNEKGDMRAQDPGQPKALTATDRGLAGRVIEVGAARIEAAERHAQILSFLDANTDGPPGGRVLLMLACNDAILHYKSLQNAVGKGSTCYKEGEIVWVEYTNDGGWTDRRQVSPQTAAALDKNGGTRVKREDWAWATKALRSVHPTRPSNAVWTGFISDARCWWYPQMPGPLVDHTFDYAPFQLLQRAALARQSSGLPQDLPMLAIEQVNAAGIELAQTTTARSIDLSLFELLKIFCGQVARSKGAKDIGRAKILEYIAQQMPVAVQAGREQVVALAAIEHAIRANGVRGEKWAPVTIYAYLLQGICDLVRILTERGIDAIDGEGFYSIYCALLEKIRKSQQPKFEAFLLAFHRYLLILGIDHLPRALSGKRQELPPCAAVVWDHELQLAKQFVDAVASTPRIALQAKFCLHFGYEIPVRTIEPWCIRMRDVQTKEPMYVAIYTRERDGEGKVKSLRRQEDIHDPGLKTLILDLENMRHVDGADDEDVLLGQPGRPDERHAQLETLRLVNDALRWATGDKLASFYDLRHTVISNRAQLVLESANASDAMSWRQLAAQCGHAGPASSRSYIHKLEDSLANISKEVRPFAWLKAHVQATGFNSIELAGHERLGVRPPLPPRMKVPERPRRPQDVDFQTRHAIAWRVAQGLKLNSIASELSIQVELVESIIDEIVQAMLLRNMVNAQVATNTRKRCMAISSHYLWARAAAQSKCEFLVKSINRECEQKQFKTMISLWQDWSLCQVGDFISLLNPRPALRLVSRFLALGVTKKALIVSSHEETAPLSREIAQLGLTPKECKDRGGRADHRLFIVPRGVDAVKASGATMSVVGIHWWMIILGSLLISMEEI